MVRPRTTLHERLTAPGPKRILSLDGGGIRGALMLGFVERIEALLRERHGDPRLRLCDYFDLIGGTSTGAIVAGALAVGMNASEVKDVYLELGGEVFGRRRLRRWVSTFDAAPLQRELARVFGDISLGGEEILTGLCITAQRVDTGSIWLLYNHPDGKYYRYNRDIPLRNAIRASTAAPTYFVPERIEVEPGQAGAFVDGGASTAANPALHLFLLATLEGYRMRFATGADQLLLVSVGTGTWSRKVPVETALNGKLWNWATQVPILMMEEADWRNQLLLQAMSRTPTPWEIDSEVGDLEGDLLGAEPLLSYLRYDARLEAEALRALDLPDLAERVDELRPLDRAESRFDLARVGEAAGRRQIRPEHFPAAFDLPTGHPTGAESGGEPH